MPVDAELVGPPLYRGAAGKPGAGPEGVPAENDEV
jgi:hypothetical protein